jgi:hypothetical protein
VARKSKKAKDVNRKNSKGQRDREAMNKKLKGVKSPGLAYGLLSSNVQTGNVVAWTEVYGRVTLEAGTSTVVEVKTVLKNDYIFLQAQNASAANLAGVFIDPENIDPEKSFQIDHALASGDEVFMYQISR